MNLHLLNQKVHAQQQNIVQMEAHRLIEIKDIIDQLAMIMKSNDSQELIKIKLPKVLVKIVLKATIVMEIYLQITISLLNDLQVITALPKLETMDNIHEQQENLD